jgi:predicted aconitase
VRLSDEEEALRAGAFGPLRRWAIEHQIKVGSYLGAADFVPVTQAHIMADTESLGVAGVEWLEGWTRLPDEQRRVRVPTITDPRGTDFSATARLKHQPWMLERERRAIAAFESFGVLMTDTCINYQTIMPPVRGEHVAYGDTGVVIYSNSVCGARSNFEGGPSALAAGLTGRTPRYGFHRDAHRRATLLVRVGFTPRELDEWGALGGIVGRLAGDYWQVPALLGIDRVPTSDEMKHFGAALASFGSVALFHMPGITAEEAVFAGPLPEPVPIGPADLAGFLARYAAPGDKLDVVVLAAPQLSLFEIAAVAAALDGRQVHADTTVIVATSPEIKHAADRMGLSTRIEAAGAVLAQGICFYQSYAREMAEANGWTRLMTNSAKLVNILGGYGYQSSLASLERCLASAVAGKVL